jgi:hypothetical protein
MGLADAIKKSDTIYRQRLQKLGLQLYYELVLETLIRYRYKFMDNRGFILSQSGVCFEDL